MKKYKLPWTHECVQNSTLEDLLLEYYEDYYDENPEEMRKEQAGEDGEFYFTDTGDPLIDKWEREFAAGAIPDLEEGMSPQAKEELRKEREAIGKARGLAARINSEDPKYASKFAQPGSVEEARLLGKGDVDPTGWQDLLAAFKE